MKQNSTPARGISALAQAGSGETISMIDTIGGVRGVVESMLPGVLFVLVFVISRNVELTVLISGIVALLQVVVRLIQRQTVTGALSGFLAVAICLVWAWKSNDARNYYMLGFITNIVYALLLSVSLVARIPGVGVVVEFIRSMPTERYRAWLNGWKSDRALYTAYTRVTVLWIVLFVLRLVVQVPLYMAGSVVWLGTARLIMGLPFWAAALWVSALIIATPLHTHITREKTVYEQQHTEQRQIDSGKIEQRQSE